MIKKLRAYCESYPEVPAFKTMLSSIYIKNGDIPKAIEANDWLLEEHPDYLFGKVNRALQYLDQDEPEKVPTILGEGLEIDLLYPDRNEFHFEEVLTFDEICVRYFLEMGLWEEAEMRVETMQDIDPEHPRTLMADQLLKDYLVHQAMVDCEEDRHGSKYVKVNDENSHLQTTQAPAFHFSEQMSWLYEDGIHIDQEKLSEILLLDREKLRQDLERILYDSVHRYDYFLGEIVGDTEHPSLALPTHALLLLSELKSSKSIDAILYLLKQGKNFLDFWLSGFYFDQINTALFHCGKNNTNRIFEFLKAPNIDGYNKSLVGENLVTIIRNVPEDRTRYVAEYRSILRKYIENQPTKIL